MKIAFAGCPRELPRAVVLHFMKVKNGALKISEWQDADIGVVGNDGDASPAPGAAGMQWLIMPGDGAGREGNTIRLPRDNWQQTLVSVLEKIVLGRGDPLAAGGGDPSPAASVPVVEIEPQPAAEVPLQPAHMLDTPAPLPVKPSIPQISPAVDSAYWQGVEQVFNPGDYPLLDILRKYAGRNLAIIFDQQRSLRIVGDLALLRLTKSSLKVFCQARDAQGWTIEEIKERQVAGVLRDARIGDDVETVPVEKLLWDVAHFVSAGRRNLAADIAQPYALRHFPDFNRVEARDSAIRLAAFLHARALTAPELCALGDASPQEVSDLLFALELGNYLGDHKRQALRANGANTGVFRKLMSKFAFGRG